MRYRIGEFARLGGTTIKTLRFYDALGLLKPAEVDARSRYRFYAAAQLQDLAAIRALKELGASLEDIRAVIGRACPARERRELLERLRTRAERSLADTRRSLHWIELALQDTAASIVPITLKQHSSARVASIRARLHSYAEIGDVERDLRRSLSPGLACGMQGVLWHRCEASGAIEGEPFVEIGRRVPPSRMYELKELPPATVASAYCEADDEAALRAYDAIDRWVHARDFRICGPKREIYVGQILEIQFPVRPV